MNQDRPHGNGWVAAYARAFFQNILSVPTLDIRRIVYSLIILSILKSGDFRVNF